MSNQKQSQVYRLAAALSNTQRWRDLTDEECESAATELRRLNSRVLELEAELVAEAARTAEATLRANQMTDQHRMQCNMREQGWQPIESAPKDGTQILAYSKACIECIYFDEDANLWVQSWEGDEDYGILGGPVAWMPLPKPPAM